MQLTNLKARNEEETKQLEKIATDAVVTENQYVADFEPEEENVLLKSSDEPELNPKQNDSNEKNEDYKSGEEQDEGDDKKYEPDSEIKQSLPKMLEKKNSIASSNKGQKTQNEEIK